MAGKQNKHAISDAAVEAALWYKQLQDTNNSAYMPLFFDQHRYLVLCGGGGSGKSIFAGRKILERVTTEAGHRWLVCRKVAKTLRESCFEQLVSQAHGFYADQVEQINQSDMRISFRNGSQILFSGLDDVEKLKSIHAITGVWIEEASELEESDFNQLDIRLRGETTYYKQIIITFNPVSILHWLKKRFFDNPTPDAKTHRSTYKDNRFLDEAAKRVLESFRETDEYYYNVYCLGEWGTTGKSVFDAAAVTRRLAQIQPPVAVGLFEYDYDGLTIKNIRFTPDKNGAVKIYSQPDKYAPYVIGGDTAGDGSDSFVGQVLDNRTGAQVATLRHTYDEDVYARQMYCLGMYYNTALIAIETNFSTYPVRELERLRYPKQYVRETIDDYTHVNRRAFGFRTDAKTRPVIVSELVRAARDDITLINDRTTLEEMLTFVRDETMKPVAEEGAHDDCVMSLAIAHFTRAQQRYTSDTPAPQTVEWTPDMWDDWRRATQAERDYLIKKWGNPKK